MSVMTWKGRLTTHPRLSWCWCCRYSHTSLPKMLFLVNKFSQATL